MKVTNWRRKLAASLVAGGLLAPCGVKAANLDTNLVTNPGFEDVDVGTVCCYLSAATKINSWSSGSLTGFAYNNELPELNGSGELGWDDGGPLAGGGKYFFGPASGDEVDYQSVTSPGLVAQNLDVSTGATGTLIASGQAAVVLSGFFTSYNGQNRHGFMQVDFLNAGGTSLGSTVINSLGEPHPWHQERGAAVLPVGTATLRTSLYGDDFNAYIDNVDVRVLNAADALIRGDFNSDGKVDSLDWVILRTNQETNLSGLTLEEAYRRGDLNEDRANNHADFVIFKTIYGEANGAGSFAAMLAGVPEPATLVFILSAGLFVLPVRCRATNHEQP